jgi:hypothetical protein
MIRARFRVAFATAVVFGSMMSACSDSKAVYPEKDRSDSSPQIQQKDESFLGMGDMFSDKKDNGSIGVGVNAYLWRAALDTLSFMPIATADPFGGTILTDWYQMPEAQQERFKLNIFIIGKVLRSDAIKVSVFKQARDSQGQWADVRVDDKMAADIENAILTRARQLRITTTVKP